MPANQPTLSPINNGHQMPSATAALAKPSPSTRSRITNGSSVLPGVDGRSATARRFRDLITALSQDTQAPMTEAMRLQIRAAASMQVHVEDLTARMARGEPVPAEEMTRAANGAIRALASLSRRAPARKRPSAAGLTSYLSGRQAVPEAAE